MSFPFDLDPDARDPGGWATSLLHNAELVLGCLNAVQARSVTEVGAFMGELTRLLLRWADETGASVTAIDTAPHPDLEALEAGHPNLQLVRDTSLNALARIEPADVVILDGDHNYYTVSHELRLIAQRASHTGRQLPLLLLHDVGWPHGRRDDYYVPERIPPEHRQPLAPAGLHPDEPESVSGGIPCDNPAEREGGPRNGVLTAAEDFIAEYPRLRLAIVPAFYGLGVIWDVNDPHADAISELLSVWDRNPVLQRMEDNRLLHLANGHVQWTIARDLRERVADRDRRLARQDDLLTRMLHSRTFAAAELYLRIRQRVPAFSRRQIRQVIG
jgi:Methyltransferase domain